MSATSNTRAGERWTPGEHANLLATLDAQASQTTPCIDSLGSLGYARQLMRQAHGALLSSAEHRRGLAAEIERLHRVWPCVLCRDGLKPAAKEFHFEHQLDLYGNAVQMPCTADPARIRQSEGTVLELVERNQLRMAAAAPALYEALRDAVQVIEQLVPEPSARGVADVVLFQIRAALSFATEGK